MTFTLGVPSVDELKLLILKIDKPQWKIGYRYSTDCKSSERQNGKALTEAISFSIRRWLKPLKELNPDRPIVDKFIYELQADFISPPLEDVEGLRAVDLRATFKCERGLSYAAIGRIYPPAVFMKLGTEVKGLMLPTLIHELGHAFGLADTYHREGFMRSRGGLQGTTGIQAASMMSSHYHDGNKPMDDLKEDDKRGIIWLYKYFYEGLVTNDCFFPDYVFVEEPRGCRPKHTLIFEIKHGYPINVLQLLKDDPSIDINAQDVSGMTALHYAAMHEHEEVVKALLARMEIKPFLTNKQGQTAYDLAVATNNATIIKMFPEPPLRKEDVNGDGVVNILDLVAVAAKFGQKDTGNADVNKDGKVDIRDLVLVAGAFGTTASAPALQAQTGLTAATVAGWLTAAQNLNSHADYTRGFRQLQSLHTMLAATQTELLANYPNPFNPETWLPYRLANAAQVNIQIYDTQGSLVRTLALGHRSAGIYQDKARAAYWDGRNAQGEPVASGVYFYTLSAGEFTATRKMLLRK